MTTTAATILAALEKKSFYVGHGKRVMNAARKLEAQGLIPNGSVRVIGVNGNGHKSQWNSPRFIPAFETLIDLRG